MDRRARRLSFYPRHCSRARRSPVRPCKKRRATGGARFQRRHVWPALVHLRLFGAGYRPIVERLLGDRDLHNLIRARTSLAIQCNSVRFRRQAIRVSDWRQPYHQRGGSFSRRCNVSRHQPQSRLGLRRRLWRKRGRTALSGARRAGVTGFGVQEHHDDGPALPMLVQSSSLSLKTDHRADVGLAARRNR